MTTLLLELPPLLRAVVVVAGALLTGALLVELGLPPLISGAVAGSTAYTRGWGPGLAVLAGVAAGLAVYIAWCLLYPRAACWWCSGKPRVTDGSGHFRNCAVCKGSGQRRRIGSRILARHRPSSD